MSCVRARDLRAAASASSSSSTSSSSASSSSSSSLAAPASSPSETYLQKRKTSVIVVRRMRRARSHWHVRCDGRGSIARKQVACARDCAVCARRKLYSRSLGITYSSSLSASLSSGSSTSSSSSFFLLRVLRVDIVICVKVCVWESVGFVLERREERGRKGETEEEDEGERESDTWLPGWAFEVQHTHTERLGEALWRISAGQRIRGIAIAQGQQQQLELGRTRSRDARGRRSAT